MKTIEAQLKEYILEKYKSVREFALAVNLPYSTIDSIFKRGLMKANVDNVIRICRELNISVDELEKGNIAQKAVFDFSKRQSITPQGQRIGRAYDKAARPVQKTVEVALEPYMSKDELSALHLYNAEWGEKRAEVPFFDLSELGCVGLCAKDSGRNILTCFASVVPQGTDCAIHIKADSMEPDIPNGAVVFVKYQPTLESGQVGIFIDDTEGKACCKRYRMDHKLKPFLESSNTSYDPIYLGEGENWRVFGHVLGVYGDASQTKKTSREAGHLSL